ncbi:MAG: DUF6020 family protein [Butyrivibrio sp.]|nr:DUF6020 family protein [Butyrivibrio sp.]
MQSLFYYLITREHLMQEQEKELKKGLVKEFIKELIKEMPSKLRKQKLFGICGGVVAVCEALGLVLTGLASDGKAYLLNPKNIALLALAIIATFILTTAALYFMWYGGRRFVNAKGENSGLLSRPCFYWAAILIGWLPCYLAYFPAIYSYDGEPQLIQYTQHTFNNHHPLAHTLFLGACYDAGQFLQQQLHLPLDGMAIYAFLQMLLLSGAFAYGFAFLIRRNVPRRLLIAVLLWCILFPVHPLMAVSTTKDTFFTAFFLLDFLMLVQAVESKDGLRRKELIRLCIVNVALMLFRKNGIYIEIVLFVIFVTAALHNLRVQKKKQSEESCQPEESSQLESSLQAKKNINLWTRLAAVTFISIALFLGAERALVYFTDAQPGESAEALNIPLMQLARAYKSNGGQMSAEDLEQLTAYLPAKGMENYRLYISDGVKMYFNNDLFRENPAGFLKIYLCLAAKYPGSYVMAPLYETMGDWFMTDVSHSLVYKDWWRDRTGYLITDATPVFAGDFMKKENLLPTVRDLYEAIATDCVHQHFLPAKILFAPALYCFLMVFAGLSLCKKKNYRQLIPWAAVMVYLLTMVAGPCVLIRYIYPFMALLPFMAYQVLKEEKAALP